MFSKDYKSWHKLKLLLNNKKQGPYFHESEIWFCHLGGNIGYEQDGRGTDFLRPVIVLKKFNNKIFWALPLTKTVRVGRYYHSFCFRKHLKSTAILSQLRLADFRRLKYKAGGIRKEELLKIKEKVKRLLD